MILVTLGTQDKSFERLLKAIEKEISNGNINDKVVVQAGWTKYKSSNMEIFDYVNPNELDKLMKNADIIITHGGVGSILNALKYNKPVIAVPRLSKYKEHTNDHQLQIVEKFAVEGYLLNGNDLENLSNLLEQAKKFMPKKHNSNNKKFSENVVKYIDNDYVSWWNKFKYVLIILIIVVISIIIYTNR